MSVTESLIKLFARDLTKLEGEISAYPSNELLWILKGDIKNTAGNLCLHLCGNLQHYIGAVLGNSGYVRVRVNEFKLKGLSKEELLIEIGKTKKIVLSTLEMLTPLTLEATYSELVFTEPMVTGYFLIHLQGHLNYHLGQINYHRRLVAFN